MNDFFQNTLDCFMTLYVGQFPIYPFELEQYPAPDHPTRTSLCGHFSTTRLKRAPLVFSKQSSWHTSSPQKVRKVINSRIIGQLVGHRMFPEDLWYCWSPTLGSLVTKVPSHSKVPLGAVGLHSQLRHHFIRFHRTMSAMYQGEEGSNIVVCSVTAQPDQKLSQVRSCITSQATQT